MTGDDIFELAERLDRIAVAVERIATALEPVTTTVVDLPSIEYAIAAERGRCPERYSGTVLPCVLQTGHAGDHVDVTEASW